MVEADVPTLPARALNPADDASAFASEIGYPVLIKASAGGGGRGMRVVRSEAELAEAVEGARREAAAYFGDETIFLERWLTSSRHVEIQILGDNYGNLVHLFERECSIQRRHQKIIEEAPSPAVDEALRTRMGQAAVQAAQSIGYSSAGTVEFLLDGKDFWFLEVNTRLQVEHPVTEAITGLDLVREQIRLAEGEELGYDQDSLAIAGHAIEARVYAEDPANDFLPAPGVVTVWEPAGKARFDSGVESGSEVSVEFDPLIAKVIAHGPSRREAAAKLARALETTRIQGITNNRDFLVATLRTPEFIAGDTTTDFIERVAPARSRTPTTAERVDAIIAVVMHAQHERRASTKVLSHIGSGWRNSVMPPERTTFSDGDGEIPVEYRAQRDGTFKVNVGERQYTATLFDVGGGKVDLAIDDRRLRMSVAAVDDSWLVHGPGGDIELIELPRFPALGAAEFTGGLFAPMPARVLATQVVVGDAVVAGQLLVVLEAMKMEHRITAPVDGTVTQLNVAEGDQVANGEMLVVLEEFSEDSSKGSSGSSSKRKGE
jgi:propionyl-CoA carboxylase alpha chain